MLRKVIAIVAFFLMGLTMWYWSTVRENSLNQLNENLEQLSQAVEQNDLSAAKTLTMQAVNQYDEKKRSWNIFANHSFSQDIQGTLSAIAISLEYEDVQSARTQLNWLKNTIQDYQEDSRITLTNIL